MEQRVYSTRQFVDYRTAEMPEWDEFDSHEDDSSAGGDDGPPGDIDAPVPKGSEGWAQMLKEFYTSAFAGATGAYFSIAGAGEDGQHMVFQLLSFRQVVSLVSSFRTKRRYIY